MSGPRRPDVTVSDIPWGSTKEHVFERLGEGHYRLELPEVESVFDVDRLHRDRSRDLCGEVVVSCMLAGARTFQGTMFSGRVNFSDTYRRKDVAARLQRKAETKHHVDWEGLLDELAYRIIQSEREGRPSQPLSAFERRKPEDAFNLHGIVLPRHHPSILFGDGGTFKSYLALYIAGTLARQGVRVLYADWEMEGEDHRDRLERLFGPEMPDVSYQRCFRPMVDEVDGLKRQVDEFGFQYIVCDSVGFATDGAPESAEAAMGYFRALRQLGIGSLQLAHVTKGGGKDGEADPTKPFGSVFWHNSGRCNWFIKRTEANDDPRIVVALFNRKTNIDRPLPPVGLEIHFDAESTDIQPVSLADVDEFAGSLPIWQRMKRALASGPMTLFSMADELGATDDATRAKLVETMSREVRRKKRVFTKLTNAPDGVHRIALVTDRSERDVA